jgi:hypothetical protein
MPVGQPGKLRKNHSKPDGIMNSKQISFATFAAVIGLSIILPETQMLPVLKAEPIAESAPDGAQQFVGMWTAQIDGTRIIELALRSEKGSLTGSIRICGFSIDTEGTGKLGLVTNEKMSPELPLRNPKVSANSVSFDWKDPDGDENHWKLELIGSETGRLVWLNLPPGLKAEPIPVSRTSK